jgi:glycosyltransferase involved in cell wall biosynthesis
MTNRFGDVGTHPQLTRLALHLRTTGHDVRAISLAVPGTITGMFLDAGIETEVIDASRQGSFVPVVVRLATLFRKWRPDAVVAFLYEAIVPGRLAAQLAAVPAMISSIRNEYFGPRRRELVIHATERLSTATVVNSKRVAESLVRRRVVDGRRLVVIHNGVDLSRFRGSAETRDTTRSALGVEEDEFLWLTIGRLAEQKAYPDLIKAFSMHAESVPRSRLLMVGRGPLQGVLEDLVHASGLETRVSILGFRDDVPQLLAAADAFVMASRYEGMANAAIEASAAGLPLVATDVGGMSELIDEEVNGYLVPPSQPHALASAMAKVALTSLPDRLAMGMRGRAHVEELCDLPRVMDSWRRLIEETVSTRARR